MEENGKLVLKQGKLVPDSAMGLGYFLLFAYVLLMKFTWGSFVLMSLWSILLVLPATIFFSKKEVVFDRNKTDSFTKRFLIMGIFRIEQQVKFDIYTLFILRTVRKSYRLNQVSSLVYKGNTMDLKDSYLAIQGKKKNDKLTYEICKGTKVELDQIIEHFIVPKKIPVFFGVPKRGFEYHPKNEHSAKA